MTDSSRLSEDHSVNSGVRLRAESAGPGAWLASLALDYLEAARRRPGAALLPIVLSGLLGVTLALVIPRQYPASASFLADGESGRLPLGGALAGLASQFGVSSSKSDSPLFYAELLTNRMILLNLLTKQYPASVVHAAEPRSLADVLRVKKVATPAGREAGLRVLGQRIAARVNPRTAVVDFTVEAETPELAVAIAEDLLVAVDSFNILSRQTRAAAQRKFFAGRVDETAADVRAAEDDLRRFLLSNRVYQSSPSLQLEQDRLLRNVVLRQTLYTALRQQLDQASLDAVRNTPTIVVLVGPLLIAKASFPKRRLIVAIFLMLGMLVAGLWLRIAERRAFRHAGDFVSWDDNFARGSELLRRKSV